MEELAGSLLGELVLLAVDGGTEKGDGDVGTVGVGSAPDSTYQRVMVSGMASTASVSAVTECTEIMGEEESDSELPDLETDSVTSDEDV